LPAHRAGSGWWASKKKTADRAVFFFCAEIKSLTLPKKKLPDLRRSYIWH
jgi:hypothetical protein